MAIDEVPEQEVLPIEPPEGSSHTLKFALILIVLAALAIGEYYTLSKLSDLRKSMAAQQAQTRQELTSQMQDQLSGRLAAMQRVNTQQLEELKDEINAAAKRSAPVNHELNRARAMVTRLEQEQRQQADLLKQELAQKADQDQLHALSQDVSAQRSDLDKTRQAVDSVRSDLGMARSEMGTLIARNHDEIEQLRRMGDRDYFEFTLNRKKPSKVAGMGLEHTKTNVKRHRFTLAVTADDLTVEKKDRTINEPIFLYLAGSKKPSEVVVNDVKSDVVRGYVSTPKGATEVAARSEGAR